MKLRMDCSLPSSSIRRSVVSRSVIAWPFLSWATTSTMTNRAVTLTTGIFCWPAADCADSGVLVPVWPHKYVEQTIAMMRKTLQKKPLDTPGMGCHPFSVIENILDFNPLLTPLTGFTAESTAVKQHSSLQLAASI